MQSFKVAAAIHTVPRMWAVVERYELMLGIVHAHPFAAAKLRVAASSDLGVALLRLRSGVLVLVRVDLGIAMADEGMISMALGITAVRLSSGRGRVRRRCEWRLVGGRRTPEGRPGRIAMGGGDGAHRQRDVEVERTLAARPGAVARPHSQDGRPCLRRT